ncbi:hypothetical protein ABZ517_14900 [Streptomyces scabiei]|uniref:hypothetical protein n=1 Tax=Streptomyces scabiei TaxID=1930 RepID=UPI0033D55E0F
MRLRDRARERLLGRIARQQQRARRQIVKEVERLGGVPPVPCVARPRAIDHGRT